jgi:hypothetical protein
MSDFAGMNISKETLFRLTESLKRHMEMLVEETPALNGMPPNMVQYLIMQTVLISGSPGSKLRKSWNEFSKNVDGAYLEHIMMGD